ncbi:hypothetical protein ACWD2L_05895 [Streptomyces sp. NPDC002754]
MSEAPILVIEGGPQLSVSTDGRSLTLVQQPLGLSVQQPASPTVELTSPGPQGPEGPQGPQGAPGAPGGAAYEFSQGVPSATWVINHNLGRKVNVSLFDATGALVISDVEHGSLNQATVTWSSPVTGSAYIS